MLKLPLDPLAAGGILLILATMNGMLDAFLILAKKRILHGLEMLVRVLLVAGAVLSTNVLAERAGVSSAHLLLTALVLFMVYWPVYNLMFRTVLNNRLGTEWEFLGSTSKYDQLLKRIFKTNTAQWAVTVEFVVFISALVAYLKLT